MKLETMNIDVNNLCSRKLWELTSCHAPGSRELRIITGELQRRRHYLRELASLRPETPVSH